MSVFVYAVLTLFITMITSLAACRIYVSGTVGRRMDARDKKLDDMMAAIARIEGYLDGLSNGKYRRMDKD